MTNDATTPVRVLVIDDSAFARALLKRVMEASGEIEIVGTASDGGEGLALIAELDPDVVTLDLTMPQVDGLQVLRVLKGRARPRVIVVSMAGIESEPGAEALVLGAIDLISKPGTSARLNEIEADLVAKVVAAGASFRAMRPATSPASTSPAAVHGVALILIGASTGGPRALTLLLAGLPATLAAPIAMVLHLPAEYTEAFARRMNTQSRLEVVEARDGMALRPGLAIVARGGLHLFIERIGRELRARLGRHPVGTYTPSVDELFSSGAKAVGAGALGVVLTGMGDDGLAGSRTIAAAGGSLLTESASSCVVYGMPRRVDEARLGALSLPIEAMAGEIARRV